MFLLAPGGHWLIPKPAVKKRFSSMSVGTGTRLGLLKLVVKAVAVFVSLNAGKEGITGLVELPLAGHGADLYSRMAVVVVLSNGAPCALA